MKIHEPGIYHIYNRGNNQQQIFFNEGNYRYFLDKCIRYLKPVSRIFAWCLMPNHFHFLVQVTEKSLEPVKSGSICMPAITNGFRLLQSSYAKGINVQEGRNGNLFQQKTKAKLVGGKEGYAVNAFFYIHQNPIRGKLADKFEDWPYSSFMEYAGRGIVSLCNRDSCMKYLGLTLTDLQVEIIKPLEEEKIKFIF